jgi:type IV secretory pathway VirB2 component (pilin)
MCARWLTRLGAFVFFALALVAAFAVYEHAHTEPCGLGFDRPVCSVRDAWQAPLAVGLAAAGIVFAGSLVHFAGRS